MADIPLSNFYGAWDAESKRLGEIAFAKTLAALNQNQGPPGGQQGGGPQGTMPPQMGGGQPPPGGAGGGMMTGGPPPGPPMPPQGGGSPQMAGPPQGMPQRPPMPPQGPPQGMPPHQPGMGGGMPPQMPQGMPQAAGGQPALSWQTIMQKVQQANPGMPPNALAAAVDRFMPLMNQQAQQQWREMSMYLREQQMETQRMSAEGRLAQGEERIRQGDERIAEDRRKLDEQRARYGLPPLPPEGGQYTPQQVASAQPGEPGSGEGQPKQPQGDAQRIARSIIDGQQPPDMKGLGRMAPAVKAELAKQGFDLTKAALEYRAAEKQVMSLNGPQQLRFQALATSVLSTIGEVRQLSQQMNQSGLTDLNKLQLETLMRTQGNTPKGQLASRYIGAVNTLKEEFANLANGGYAPTESVWALANRQINENYGVKQMQASLGEVGRLIQYRVNAQNNVGGGRAGPNAPNRYTGQGQQPAQQPQGEGSFNDHFQGLPEGWSVEKH